ncbi:peptidylprolyl isomerase [Candidatus Blastococcus massiliensis]|uniref:peptidylprolyl isomerase n=1 Tax=Candidatus Blastococcus massiliensis TaxID=1470358 RepID=UPI0004B35609|nr:peptidylprolyl isomerase [Candidatus Blastococcus massiliensis]
MPTNKQRREAAQRHLQRQLERRSEQARKRRRNLGITLAALAAVVVVGAGLLIAGVFSDDDEAASADGTVSCEYTPDAGPNLTDVGTPPSPEETPAQGTTTLLMSTNQGDLTLTLDRSTAPCAAASFTYLAEQEFFDGSPCHRMVNQPTFGVLQCGDPSGTGSGGPTYKYAEEVTDETTYPAGTIAMAKSGPPNTTGSQFFLVFDDAQLSPDYTVVGTIDEASLAVLEEIAEAGNDGSMEPAPGGGAPNEPVTIESMTVAS